MTYIGPRNIVDHILACWTISDSLTYHRTSQPGVIGYVPTFVLVCETSQQASERAVSQLHLYVKCQPCISDCLEPVSIDNGEVTHDAIIAGSVAQYSCQRGFRLAGRRDRLCLVTGEWEGKVPTCASKYIFMMLNCEQNLVYRPANLVLCCLQE